MIIIVIHTSFVVQFDFVGWRFRIVSDVTDLCLLYVHVFLILLFAPLNSFIVVVSSALDAIVVKIPFLIVLSNRMRAFIYRNLTVTSESA